MRKRPMGTVNKPEQAGDSANQAGFLSVGRAEDPSEFMTSDDFMLVPRKKKSRKHVSRIADEKTSSVKANHGVDISEDGPAEEDAGVRDHTSFWRNRTDSTSLVTSNDGDEGVQFSGDGTCKEKDVPVLISVDSLSSDSTAMVVDDKKDDPLADAKGPLAFATENHFETLQEGDISSSNSVLSGSSANTFQGTLYTREVKKTSFVKERGDTIQGIKETKNSNKENKVSNDGEHQLVNQCKETAINFDGISNVCSNLLGSEVSSKVSKKCKRDRKKKQKMEDELFLEELSSVDKVEKKVAKSNHVFTVANVKVPINEVQIENDEMNSQVEGKDPVSSNCTMKTASQKRKEKRMREKQKHMEKNEHCNEKNGSQVNVKDEVMLKPSGAESVSTAEINANEMSKKGKKTSEDEKKDKRRPTKKQLAIIQEALKKAKEEEELLKKEAEAKQKAAEEAERLRQEQLKVEQERKDRKKLKDKEKREMLRAQGKLLTKAQKKARARMEATLAAYREQGINVPMIGEKKPLGMRLGSFKSRRTRLDSQQSTDDSSTVSSVRQKTMSSSSQESCGKDSITSSDSKESCDVSTMAGSSVSRQQYEGCRLSCSDDSDILCKKSPAIENLKPVEICLESANLISIKPRVKQEKVELNCADSYKLRSPVVCVLGHVDTGKTKLLDYIRKTHVQDNEAGHITQQIGATMIPQEALKEKCKMVNNFQSLELKVPGLLVIDTPGHESFGNLRYRGSSICDIAVLVVDIMHGLQQQTIESINLLKNRKTPFIVALNKVDRIYGWKQGKDQDIEDVIKNQTKTTQVEFNKKCNEVILQFANESLNTVLYYENKDPRSFVSMVPTSAVTGDGMGNILSMVVQLSQSMMSKKLTFSEELQATVLEVKAIPGLGTTIDVILVNGRLREGDTIVTAGQDGPISTQIRSLLMPQPLKELRVKNPYKEYKEVKGAQGVKLTGKDLDKVIAGLPILVAENSHKVDSLKQEMSNMFQETMNAINLSERGVYVQASTLGSLEALLYFLETSAIPYFGVKVGPVVKKDVMKASIMLEHDSQYAVILAFDVKIERDAHDLAESLGVKIFQADVIYHLFDRFIDYRDELKKKRIEGVKHMGVFPCKLKILPQYIFSARDPIVIGVTVEAGMVKLGTPLCVPSRDNLNIGTVSIIEMNNKQLECAKKGQNVCLKIEPKSGESSKVYGRHFDEEDILVSRITRQSIDICKEHFRDVLQSSDWQLMVELKKTFQIL